MKKIANLKGIYCLKFGRDRAEVEEEIMDKYRQQG